MTSIPDDAQRSEDGQWWWDETQQQWQPVAGVAPTGDAAPDDPAASATYAEAQGEIPINLAEITLTDQEISEIMQRGGVSEEPNA